MEPNHEETCLPGEGVCISSWRQWAVRNLLKYRVCHDHIYGLEIPLCAGTAGRAIVYLCVFVTTVIAALSPLLE